MSRIKEGIYSSSELEQILGNKMAISRLVESGDISKVGRGYYATNNINYESAIFGLVAKYYSEGIISGHTCLHFYGLSDFADDRIHLDFPVESGFKRNSELFEFHRVTSPRLSDIEKVNIKGSILKIYSPERALFEAVKLEKGFGNMSATACKNYLKKFKPDIKKIAFISEEFGENGRQLLRFITNIRDDLF